jgi:hypothetical protein
MTDKDRRHGPHRDMGSEEFEKYISKITLLPDRREIENPIEIVRRLMTALHNGRKFPTLRPDVLTTLVWFKDDTSRCSLCGESIGAGDNDELPIILWTNKDKGSLCFHSLCLLKSIKWSDWADLRTLQE